MTHNNVFMHISNKLMDAFIAMVYVGDWHFLLRRVFICILPVSVVLWIYSLIILLVLACIAAIIQIIIELWRKDTSCDWFYRCLLQIC